MSGKSKVARRRRKSQSHPVEIRQMRLDDLPAVFALGQQLFTAEDLPTLYRSWDDDEVMQLFGSDEETCLVAVSGDRLAGFALGSLMEKPRNAWRYAWLEWLGISPDFKRQGVATRLLNHLTSLFIQANARIMLVDTFVENDEAIAFFRKNDFGHELKHVYLSRNLDDHPEAVLKRESQKLG
ncbi:MAG: N-acetyltransferase [Verrucomicrobiota bacterium]